MAMGIGAITAVKWSGPGIQANAPDVATITRPGYAGTALLIGAAHPLPIDVETVTIAADDADEQAATAAIRALVGTVTTAEDHRGVTTSDCAVLGAVVASTVWSTKGWLITTRWQLLIG